MSKSSTTTATANKAHVRRGSHLVVDGLKTMGGGLRNGWKWEEGGFSIVSCGNPVRLTHTRRDDTLRSALYIRLLH